VVECVGRGFEVIDEYTDGCVRAVFDVPRADVEVVILPARRARERTVLDGMRVEAGASLA